MSAHWMDAFRNDADQAVADLFSGRAGGGASLRLDVPELLYRVFPPVLGDERETLDRSLLRWLTDMRSDYPGQVDRLGVSAYAKRVGDALVALHLLDLPVARDQVRTGLDAWLRWLVPLRLAPDRDPALECWRLMTRGQPTASHVGAWMRLAADPRAEYFGVAWLGLKLLPNNGDARRNQILMLQAAVRHAVATCHDLGTARRWFNRRLAAMRGMFPRSPAYWNGVLFEVCDTLVASEEGFSVELAHALRPKANNERRWPSRSTAGDEGPPAKAVFDRLRADILDCPTAEGLVGRLFELSARNLRHAEATGESGYFVQTLCNLGSRLLEEAPLADGALAEFGTLIERALAWEPANPYCWMLWADWFRVRGDLPAREWTLREMGRLFPNNAHCRVELSRLLMARSNDYAGEAERLLRQAAERSPASAHARVELARLLAVTGRADEARPLLRDVLAQDPENEVATSVLEGLRLGELSSFSEDEDCGDIAELADSSPILDELARRGELGGEFHQALCTNNQVMVTTPPRIMAEATKGDGLGGFYAQWLKLKGIPECPPHAWAWRACRLWQRQSATEEWRSLAEQFPEAAMETDFLCILVIADGQQLPDDQNRWQSRYHPNGAPPTRPAATYMKHSVERLDYTEADARDEIALAVLSSGAVGMLEFTGAVTGLSG